MPAYVPVLVSVALFIAAAAFGFAFRMNSTVAVLKSTVQSNEDFIKSIPELQKQVAVLNQSNETFWKILGPAISGIIAHPNAVNRDHLVNRLDAGTITYDQALELSSRLAHAKDEETDAMMKLAYALKLAQVEVLLSKLDTEKAEEVGRCKPTGPTFSTE